MNVETGIQIDLIGTLRRRATLIGVTAGALFLVTYWIAMALPNQYASYSTLLIEPQAVNEMLVRPTNQEM